MFMKEFLTLRVEGKYMKIRDSKIQHSANHESCASFVVDDGVSSVVLQELQEEKPKDEPAVQSSVARAKKIAKARKKKKEKEGADQIGEETKSPLVCRFVWRVKVKMNQRNGPVQGVGVETSYKAHKPP